MLYSPQIVVTYMYIFYLINELYKGISSFRTGIKGGKMGIPPAAVQGPGNSTSDCEIRHPKNPHAKAAP